MILERLGNWRYLKMTAVILSITFFVSQVTIVFVLGSADQLLVQLQFTFDPVNFYSLLEAASSEQKEALIRHFYFDFVHPIIYAATLFVCLLFVRKSQTFSANWLYLPLLAGLADLVENCFELYLFTHLETPVPALVPVAASFSVIKWTLAFSALGFFVYRCRPNQSRRILGKGRQLP